MSKLKPCPFCGCKEVINNTYYFICNNMNCRAFSPTGKNKKDTIKKWNRRSK
jgi:Lar family restriction alleviation protein